MTLDKCAKTAVVGNVNLDIKTSRVLPSESLFADGETSVDEIYESIGGGGANTAVAGAMMGGTVHFCASIGDDALGERLEAVMADFGVIPHFSRKPVATGRSINLNWTNSNRHFISCLPNTHALSVEDVDIKALVSAGCRSIHRADIWFAGDMLPEGNREVFKAAREAGMQTSVDINYDPEWIIPNNEKRISERKACVVDMLSWVDWVHGNESELMTFTNTTDIISACKYVIDRRAGCIILHRGGKGCAYYSASDGMVEFPATPVENPVCETGTGDVFTVAFLLMLDMPLPERLRQCAGIAAKHLAGNPSYIPRLK